MMAVAQRSSGPVLVPILGDQLSPTLAALRDLDRDDAVLLLAEVWDEATYVRHHKAKIALVFSAMRHFADELRAAGWRVDYTRLDDADNAGSLTGELVRAAERHAPREIRCVEAGEWRLRRIMDEWGDKLACPVTILADDRFICTQSEFNAWAGERRQLRMEFFYREMRRKTGLLLDPSGQPEGGQWNYDADNRKPPSADMTAPERPHFPPDAVTAEVIALVEARFPDHFGSLARFDWPVTAAQAEAAAEAFIAERLAKFGPYQDAMVHGRDQLWHSLLSTSINLGLLDPLTLCRQVEAAWRLGAVPLNSAEGFIRQIIGWREYVRGFYFHEMPQLAEANALSAERALPEFYWTGETDMRCLADCVRSTRDNAHAHHIQRLMVLGNFALLAGVRPQEVEDWFLVVYADAYDWVELPNVAAMILYADGGRLASKPYAASGAYIDRMSDYCKACRYNVREKTGPDACPFNPLYWHFMHRNRALLEGNPRIGRLYANWDRMSADRRAEYLASANEVLSALIPAQPGWARAAPGEDAD